MSATIVNPIDLDSIEIREGGHRSFEEGVCAMELVAYMAGLPHSDKPSGEYWTATSGAARQSTVVISSPVSRTRSCRGT